MPNPLPPPPQLYFFYLHLRGKGVMQLPIGLVKTKHSPPFAVIACPPSVPNQVLLKAGLRSLPKPRFRRDAAAIGLCSASFWRPGGESRSWVRSSAFTTPFKYPENGSVEFSFKKHNKISGLGSSRLHLMLWCCS